MHINYDAHNGYPYRAGGPRADRARSGVARGNVDAAHPRMDARQSRRRQGRPPAEPLHGVLPHRRIGLRRRGAGRPGHSALRRPLDRGRQEPACLRHAVLHRSRPAALRRPQHDGVPPHHDRPGHRLGDRRAGARRPVLRGRRRGGPDGGAHQAGGALHHAAAARARPDRRRSANAAAAGEARGEGWDRESVAGSGKSAAGSGTKALPEAPAKPLPEVATRSLPETEPHPTRRVLTSTAAAREVRERRRVLRYYWQ